MYYVDNETGNYIEQTYGRCDRESKCGYFRFPSSNLPLNYIKDRPLPIRPTFLEQGVIGDYCNNYDNNNFITFLLKHFKEEDVIRAIERYYIGTSDHWKGSTIFWQIDQNLNIRTGKVMQYDSNTGRRVKKPYPRINWMHKV